MQKDKELCSIALVGAPCAGKTSILEMLKAFIVETKNKDVVVLDEAWDQYEIFANFLFHFFIKGGEQISPAMIPEIAEAMKVEVVLTISTEVPLPDTAWLYRIVNAPDGKVFYEIDITLWDLYLLRNLGFLEDLLTGVSDEDELRQVIQKDLLRVQALKEIKAIMGTSGMNKVMVTDGSLASIISYWPGMSLADFQPIFDSYGLPIETTVDAIGVYDVVILLETLALLNPVDYEKHFYDGRRLDTPADTREVHQRLLALVEKHPHHIIIPAALSLEEKFKIVLNIVKEISQNSS